jgi:hypothetical protein
MFYAILSPYNAISYVVYSPNGTSYILYIFYISSQAIDANPAVNIPIFAATAPTTTAEFVEAGAADPEVVELGFVDEPVLVLVEFALLSPTAASLTSNPCTTLSALSCSPTPLVTFVDALPFQTSGQTSPLHALAAAFAELVSLGRIICDVYGAI